VTASASVWRSKRLPIGTAAENILIGQAVALEPATGAVYLLRAAQAPGASILLYPEPANRLAPPIAPAGRKWPIGNVSQDMYAGLTWGTRLAAAREHASLTLDALGSKLNPPRTRKDISAMEHGRRGLSVELCAQLADALDCDRLWLAGWTLPGDEP